MSSSKSEGASRPPRVLVILPTYRRNDLLTRALGSLSAVVRDGLEVSLLVIDNAAHGEARSVVPHSLNDMPVRYLIEQSPGLSAVRNRGIDETPSDVDFVAWLDDDEVVTPTWLKSLIAVAETFNADVVAGPVLPLDSPEVPRWVLEGGHWDRQRQPTGTRLSQAASGNVLMRRAILDRKQFRFEAKLNFTGGEDTHFFRTLHSAGARIIWCDEAVAYEHVLPERANLRWLLRRARQIGNVNARYWRDERGLTRVIVGGILRVLCGFALCLLDVIARGGRPHARSLNMLGHGLGMLQVSIGKSTAAYAR